MVATVIVSPYNIMIPFAHGSRAEQTEFCVTFHVFGLGRNQTSCFDDIEKYKIVEQLVQRCYV
jgi:hypothetical protein